MTHLQENVESTAIIMALWDYSLAKQSFELKANVSNRLTLTMLTCLCLEGIERDQRSYCNSSTGHREFLCKMLMAINQIIAKMMDPPTDRKTLPSIESPESTQENVVASIPHKKN